MVDQQHLTQHQEEEAEVKVELEEVGLRDLQHLDFQDQ
jgi:hypothetical protein